MGCNAKLEAISRASLAAKEQTDIDGLQDTERLKRDYGCTRVHERTFAYPTTSVGKALLERYPSACQASMDEKPDVSRRERKANNQKMTDFTNLVIACTHVNCANDLMKENLNFSIGVHEESSRARLGTQTAALVHRGVEAHIFIGDPKHIVKGLVRDNNKRRRSP